MKIIKKVYKDKALDKTTVYKWVNCLSNCVTAVENDEDEVIPSCVQTWHDKTCTGSPSLETSPSSKTKVDELIKDNRRISPLNCLYKH